MQMSEFFKKEMETSVQCLQMKDLPLEILTKVLSFVPAQDLIMKCGNVCRSWWSVVMGQTIWRYKCEQKALTLTTIEKENSDFMNAFFNHYFGKNLLRNPDARLGLSHWVIEANGGNGFTVETYPAGSRPIQDFVVAEENVKFWTTSYEWCKKSQLIDLNDTGLTREFLDKIFPDIELSEWYSARWDCGCKYELKVSLLAEDMNVIDEFHFEDKLPSGDEWHQIQHTFRGYQPGVRFIEYRHSGKDKNWWQGHYGVKMTLSAVALQFYNIRQNICESERLCSPSAKIRL